MSPASTSPPPSGPPPASTVEPPVEGLDALVDRLAAEQADSGAAVEHGAAEGPGAERPVPPLVAPEGETLVAFLDFLRSTVLWKTDGLSDQQAARRLVGSETTVTGVIRHLADTERYWFREVLGGVPLEDVGYRWSDGRDTDREWAVTPGATLAEAQTDYRTALEQSRAQLVGRDLSEELHGGGEVRSVRWVLTHMIEETGRHAGQLDILVELLDGRSGE